MLASLNMTPYAFAKRSGISPASIYSFLEGNVCPSLSRARMIARTLEMPLDDILFLAEADILPTAISDDTLTV